jgi:hypothetical protein
MYLNGALSLRVVVCGELALNTSEHMDIAKIELLSFCGVPWLRLLWTGVKPALLCTALLAQGHGRDGALAVVDGGRIAKLFVVMAILLVVNLD